MKLKKDVMLNFIMLNTFRMRNGNSLGWSSIFEFIYIYIYIYTHQEHTISFQTFENSVYYS